MELKAAENKQVFYDVSGFILKIQVVDGSRRVLYKDKCNIFNKKELNRIVEILRMKFNVPIEEAIKLKEESGWGLG